MTRRFYARYPGRLDKNDRHPLKRRREALKFLNAGFHRRAPGLMLRGDADISKIEGTECVFDFEE